MVDSLEDLLTDTSNLSLFCFYARLFEDHFQVMKTGLLETLRNLFQMCIFGDRRLLYSKKGPLLSRGQRRKGQNLPFHSDSWQFLVVQMSYFVFSSSDVPGVPRAEPLHHRLPPHLRALLLNHLGVLPGGEDTHQVGIRSSVNRLFD